MTTDDLIRLLGDVELPTPGWWPIAAHPVNLTAGRMRRRTLAATASGGLHVAERLEGCALHLLVDTDRTSRADDLVVDARLTSAGTDGTWRFQGSVQGTVTLPVTVDVAYHGVYRHGDRANAWLTVHASLPAVGGRPRALLDGNLHADFPHGPS